jgi:hypothetical protein
MKTVESKAKAVATKLGGKLGHEAAFDPSMILVIIQIIQQVLAAIQACKKPPSAVTKMAESPAPFQRFKLRRIVRDQIDDPDFYAAHGDDITDAVLHVGSTVTADEASHLFAEVKEG